MGQRPRDPNKGIARSASSADGRPAGGSDYAASLNGAQDTSPYARPRSQKRATKPRKPARRPFARGSVDEARLPGELDGASARVPERPELHVVPDAPRAARVSRPAAAQAQPVPMQRRDGAAREPLAPAARPAGGVAGAAAGRPSVSASAPDARTAAEPTAAAPAKKPSYGCGNEPFGGNPVAGDSAREELLDVPAVTAAPAGEPSGTDIPSVGADFDDDPSEVFSPYEAPSAHMASKWLTQFFGATPAAPVDEEPLDAPVRTKAPASASPLQTQGQVAFPAGASPSLTLVPGGASRKARPAGAAERAPKPASAGQVAFPAGASPSLTLVPGGSTAASAEPGASGAQVQSGPAAGLGAAPVASGVAAGPALAPADGPAPVPSGAAADGPAPAPTSAADVVAPAAAPASPGLDAAVGPAPAAANVAPTVGEPAASDAPAAPDAAPARRRPRLPHVSARSLARPFVALGTGVARAFSSPDAPRVLVAFAASIVMLLVSVGMLYGPSQELYLAMRQNERLTSELAANEARNDKMAARVDSLQTQEGIEDEARERFGLVLPGENLVRVVGLSSEGDAPASETPAEIKRGSGTNTHTWATDLLDRVFGVQDVGATSAEATDDASAQVSESAGADASVPASAVEGADAGE